MADVLIRGMEMPKGCFNCNFCSLGNGFCYGLKRYVNESREREKDCPLVSLPKGHGRLIDADVLQEKFKKFHDGKRLMLIDTAPTIVPAEGSVNDGT